MTAENPAVLVIEAGRAERHYWRDLWRYRELFYFLAWRDILVRYKQTVVGIAWSVIRPLLTLLVFALVFGRLARLPSEGFPYPLLVFAGLLPWHFFATALSEAGMSLVANANLLTKVYFPRVLVPAGTVLVSLVDFLISLVLLALVMAWYRHVPDGRIVALPAFFLLAALAALGSGLWLCSLNVKYRDFQYVVPFVVQFGLYVSPVGFSSALVPEQWRLVYALNPMVGVIDGFRWSLLGGDQALHWPSLAVSASVAAALFVTGVRYFRRTERTLADVI